MNDMRLLDLHADRRAMANAARELATLDAMTSSELAEKYRELFGEPTRSRNKEYLRKRIAWRVQEYAEGSLSPYALDRIAHLAERAPARWREPAPRKGRAEPVVAATVPAYDPRLPPAGAVLSRVHDGVEHQVTVLEGGFEYQGKHYSSLSKIARLITGTSWNGFLFFFGPGHKALRDQAKGHK
jgi:hypothetical protein